MEKIEESYNSKSHSNPAYSPNPLQPEQQTKKEEQEDFIEISI